MKNIFLALICFCIAGCAVPASPKKKPLAPTRKKVSREIRNEITINVEPKMDVLFIIDDTGSMTTHQKNLSKNIDSFTRGFLKNQLLDYHIGVTTTDVNNQVGELRSSNGNPNIIHKQIPNALEKLRQNLIVGMSNESVESVFTPTMRALETSVSNGINKGFLRQDAQLVLIFVTDANDQSQISVENLLQYVAAKKGGPENFIAYGAIIPPDVSDCDRDTAVPTKIMQFIERSGGSHFNLCDPDFGPHLAKIGDEIGQRSEVFIPLITVPILETVKVTYGSQIIANHPLTGWSYDPDRIGLYFGKELKLSKQAYGTRPKVTFIPAKKPTSY